MPKKVKISDINELTKVISSITEAVINESLGNYDENDKTLSFLEELCDKMGASFAEYDDENGYYVIESKSMLDLRYIFEPDPENGAKLVRIEGIEEFKQAFNEISVLRHVMEGKELTKIS